MKIESRDKMLRRNHSITAQLLDTDQQSSTSLSLVLLVGCEQDLKVKYVFVTFIKIFCQVQSVFISEGTEPTS